MYAFRERMAAELGLELLVHTNPEALARGISPFTHGSAVHTDIWKTEGLKQALDKHGFDAAFGGARRDEEKSRAKERDLLVPLGTAPLGSEEPASRAVAPVQRAEAARASRSACSRCRNWTELDVWLYIYLEQIPIVPLYFAAERPVVERDGTLIMVDDERMPLEPGETPLLQARRFRTLGCYPLTGAVESDADTLPAIIQEMLLTRTSRAPGPRDRPRRLGLDGEEEAGGLLLAGTRRPT